MTQRGLFAVILPLCASCGPAPIPEESRPWAEEVHQVVKARKGDLMRCRDAAHDPGAFGRVVAQIQIDRAGKIVAVRVSPESSEDPGGRLPALDDAAVHRCVANVFRSMTFPAPRPTPKKWIVISYPWVFAPPRDP